jgi:hypothetical protein
MAEAKGLSKPVKLKNEQEWKTHTFSCLRIKSLV